MPGRLRFLALRRSFSVAFIEKGGSIKALQELLGHSELRTTSATYAHVTDDALQEAVNLVGFGPLDLFEPK